jgi:hypothetical protein
MSSKNGARVVPLLEAANIASAQAANSAQGMGGDRGTGIVAAEACDWAVTRCAAATR